MRTTLSSMYIVLLLVGCELLGLALDGGVRLSLDGTVFETGQDVTLRLDNSADQHVGYNLCFAYLMLQRETDDGWQDVAVRLVETDAADIACTAELRRLAPGETATTSVYLRPELEGGTYRIKTEVEWMRSEKRQTVATPAFEVTR